MILSSSNNNKDIKDLLDTKIRIHKTLKPYNQARQRDFSQGSQHKSQADPKSTYYPTKPKPGQEEAIEISSSVNESSINDKADIKFPLTT